MHINRRCLTTPVSHTYRVPLHIRGVLTVVVLILPLRAGSALEPYTQEFLVTAYYSPLPGQCCYVKGGLEADKILNGEGIQAADGTAVYPGMLAAPSSYAFGTKVALPGIGMLEVHDRGGAIQQLAGGIDRLDIWAGYGEEGLARALEFGLQRITGTVYPPGFDQPATAVDLKELPAPLSQLERFKLDGTSLLSVAPKVNEYSLSVAMLQKALHDLGYFEHDITGSFGIVTQDALTAFLRDYQLNEPTDRLTVKSAAYLLAAAKRNGVDSPIDSSVNAESSPSVIQAAQRTLRFLGYYSGRTDGVYSEAVQTAILRFQQEHALAGDWESPGAGQIGPITMTALRAQWDRALVAKRADRLLILRSVEERVASNLRQFLDEGMSGPQVRMLQELLVERGLFPEDEINGIYGPLTKQSVAAFQKDRGIITHAFDEGAGRVGPATLAALRKEEARELYGIVRSQGIHSL